MNEGKRPGGLTALAVLNFVFGGINVLLLFGMVMTIAVMANPEIVDDPKAAEDLSRLSREVGPGPFYVLAGLFALLAFLLIASGVGYLQQKKVLGRGLGNAYAVVSLASTAFELAVMPDEAGSGFNLLSLIWVIYPVLTLVLLNTTFKHDFVR